MAGRVLVVGGGIAGCAAALAVDKAGYEVAVYEAHPDSGADIGAFLTLASNGMVALGQLAVAEAVANVAFPLTSLRLVGDTGDEIATTPLNGHGDSSTRYQCLRRAELCRVLQSAVAECGIPIHHGARLTSVAEGSDVEARFHDGRIAKADLLIGADGLNSVVRSLIDPDVAAPRYVGQRVFYGYTANAAPPSAPARIDMIRGNRSAFGYAVSPSGETYWFARVTDERLTASELADGTPAHWRETLVPLLRPDATPAADIVAATGDELMVTNAHDLPDVPCWHTGRVLIIGDAAHAASPATGQGASMALEDAVVLAKALRDTATTAEALATYERLRRPRVAANIAASAQLTTGPSRPRSRPAPTDAEDLLRLLDWDTPIAQCASDG